MSRKHQPPSPKVTAPAATPTPELTYDVVVVGAGITGLSALYHLRSLGVKRVAWSSDAGSAPSTALASGFVIGGQLDNFTRLSHAHGSELAGQLWRFGDAAFTSLMSYCREAGVPMVRQRRLRLATSKTELTECQQAVRELRSTGLAATLSAGGALDLQPALALRERVLAIQDDGPNGGWVDVSALIRSLSDASADAPRLPGIHRLIPHQDRIDLELVDGRRLSAEIVILGTHLATRLLAPEIAPALVSVADQWSEVTLTPDQAPRPELAGLCFSANHTYEWGVFRPSGGLELGGGRYLRPLAGLEAERATAEPKINAHLLEQLAKTFGFGSGAQVVQTYSALDIRPCDELPIIGPMFGNGRVLVGTGYMGTGLTLGFAAGICLAELVQTGTSRRLPRRLWPERLRSMES